MNQEIKVFLIRHGETNWTRSGQHTGTTDLSLTEKGKAQALELAQHLKNTPFDSVFVSPLKRALETCNLSGFSSQAVIDPLLVEWDYGEYEGLTTAQIHKINPGWSIFSHGAPGGETPEQVGMRADLVLKKIFTLKGNIALFSSGHFLRVLTARWLQFPPLEGRHFILSTASISILSFERATPALLTWNETF